MIRRLVCACASLVLLGSWQVAAQTRREHLIVRLAVTPATEAGTGEVLVRIWNAGAEDVNMPPIRIRCTSEQETEIKGAGVTEAVAATILVSVEQETGTLKKSRIPLMPESCTFGREGAWRHIAHGQYIEWKTDVAAGVLAEPGAKYTVRAAYSGPRLTGDERSEMRYAGMLVPRGRYVSNTVTYVVSDDGTTVSTKPAGRR